MAKTEIRVRDCIFFSVNEEGVRLNGPKNKAILDKLLLKLYGNETYPGNFVYPKKKFYGHFAAIHPSYPNTVFSISFDYKRSKLGGVKKLVKRYNFGDFNVAKLLKSPFKIEHGSLNLLNFLYVYCNNNWRSDNGKIYDELFKEMLKIPIPQRFQSATGKLYRGIFLEPDVERKLVSGQPVRLRKRIATSWTKNKKVAEFLGNVVLVLDASKVTVLVNVAKVFNSFDLDIPKGNEKEIIVLGNGVPNDTISLKTVQYTRVGRI